MTTPPLQVAMVHVYKSRSPVDLSCLSQCPALQSLSLTGKLMSRRRGLLTAENAVMEHLVSERDCRAGHCERQDRSTGDLLL